MAAWVALLRGVNVGGVKVEMAGLRAMAAALGWRNARTHVASGNLVFDADGDAPALALALEAALAARHGRAIPVLVLSAAELRGALALCPFAPAEGKHVHAFFLFAEPALDGAAYEAHRAPTEELALRGRTAWLHAPEGIGRSRLAERMHKVLAGTDMTARNLNTVRALAEMLDAHAPG